MSGLEANGALACGENGDSSKSHIYTDAEEYWATVPASVNGMLGDLGYVSRDDVKQSKALLDKHLKRELLGQSGDGGRDGGRALDCGAGIGRTTRHLLLPIFLRVDMVDVNKPFLDEADNYIGKLGGYDMSRVCRHCIGLQDFRPDPTVTYDLIWSQWVLGHLLDDDLVSFFARMREAMTPAGLFVIKENVSSPPASGGPAQKEFDETDSSWTRPREDLIKALNTAGLLVVEQRKQAGFPAGLFDVYMLVCRRWEKKSESTTSS